MKVRLTPGESVQGMLAAAGVEFPCGGAGTCGGCRVRILHGALPVTPQMEQLLTPAELGDGWRLACCARVDEPVVVETGNVAMPILSDHFALEAPKETGLRGTGIAVDLGTTTLVVQAIDLATGEVLGAATDLNPQATRGADVMTRIAYAMGGGAGEMASAIRERIGALLPGPAQVVLLAGNTAMHHLFCGIDVTPLAAVPFESDNDGEQVFAVDRPGLRPRDVVRSGRKPLPHGRGSEPEPRASASGSGIAQHHAIRDLGWALEDGAEVRFLPCLGGFVGSDVLAGIMATGMAESDSLQALIDLGTNGEIVVGNASRMICASTAAGPAFEAGNIRMGMRASAGAIAHVDWRDGGFHCQTIDDVAPRGVCGSGLVDAVAAALDAGVILPSGRMPSREFVLQEPVRIAQADVRELQLAKGAIAAGLRILTRQWGAALHDIERVYLAGAFGNYVRVESARRIGLIEVDAARVVPAGNTSLRGVKMALLCPDRGAAWMRRIRGRCEHISLASDAEFHETFAECMTFPDGRRQPGRGIGQAGPIQDIL